MKDGSRAQYLVMKMNFKYGRAKKGFHFHCSSTYLCSIKLATNATEHVGTCHHYNVFFFDKFHKYRSFRICKFFTCKNIALIWIKVKKYFWLSWIMPDAATQLLSPGSTAVNICRKTFLNCLLLRFGLTIYFIPPSAILLFTYGCSQPGGVPVRGGYATS